MKRLIALPMPVDGVERTLRSRIIPLVSGLLPDGKLSTTRGAFRGTCAVRAQLDIDVDPTSSTFINWYTATADHQAGDDCIKLVALILFRGDRRRAFDWARQYLALEGPEANAFLRRSIKEAGGPAAWPEPGS